jgi:hypothetical protein
LYYFARKTFARKTFACKTFWHDQITGACPTHNGLLKFPGLFRHPADIPDRAERLLCAGRFSRMTVQYLGLACGPGQITDRSLIQSKFREPISPEKEVCDQHTGSNSSKIHLC